VTVLEHKDLILNRFLEFGHCESMFVALLCVELGFLGLIFYLCNNTTFFNIFLEKFPNKKTYG